MVVQRSPTPPLARGGAIPTHMHFVYLLKSNKDNKFYIGYTAELDLRMRQHVQKLVESTKDRGLLELVYFEGYTDKDNAQERERKLKDFGSAYSGLLKRLGYM